MLAKTLLLAAASAGLWLQAAAKCNDYVLVNIRGTTEPQQRSIAFINMTANTLAALPNGVSHDLVYPASGASNSSSIGYTNLVKFVEAGIKSCPKQKYAFLGYSQGATVASLALTRFQNPKSAEFKAIAAVLVVGNPGHKPYQTQANVDQYGYTTTNGYLGGFYKSGVRIPDSFYRSLRVIDICFQGDVVCAPAYANSSFLDHIKYGYTATVQTIGTNFLIGQLTPESNVGPKFG